MELSKTTNHGLMWIIFLLPWTAALLASASYVYYAEVEKQGTERATRETAAIGIGKEVITKDLHAIKTDLSVLAQHFEFYELPPNPTPVELDGLMREFLVLSKATGLYDSVRYLNENGNELIRINFNGGNPAVALPTQLQDKSDRYYYTDTANLRSGQIYMSPFDLNIEDGAIEKPFKPVIRFVTPVFDKEGRKRGIVILNYLGSKLLGNFRRVMADFSAHSMLLNQEGFWLYDPNPDLEWSFMLNRETRFVSLFAQAWQTLEKTDAGQFHDTQGLFTFDTIYPLQRGFLSSNAASLQSENPAQGNQYHWKVVSHVPQEILQAGTTQIAQSLLLIFGPMFGLLVIGTWWLAGLRIKNRQIEAELIERQLHQSQKMDALGQLTGGVAHDFNNLITAIIGNMELVRDRVDDDVQARKFADSAIDAASRGADLTRRLLAFSREKSVKTEPTEVRSNLEDALKIIRRLLGDDIDIEVTLNGNIWHALMDGVEFQNAVLNLALNARDAMPNGGKLKIEAKNEQLGKKTAAALSLTPGDYVLISVEDSGTGIPPEHLEKVMEPFFTTKDVGQGTGLGLSMVYGFATRSGGQFQLSSKHGTGTVIKLYLPRATQHKVEQIVTKAPQETKLPTGAETILVVEDDADVRAFIDTTLKLLGYQTVEADDGPSAIALMANTDLKIDLLLSDITMPNGMDGFDVAEDICKQEPDIKVLLMSGYVRNAAMQNKLIGMDFLAKPFSKEKLARTVRFALDGQRKTATQAEQFGAWT